MKLLSWPRRFGSTRAGRALLGVAAAVLLGGSACRRDGVEREAALLTGGSPERGRGAIERYGCGGCHTIPGVEGARGLVGPPLAGVARRVYLGGVLPNSPENMVRWIRDPQRIDPLTAMPTLGVSEAEARDIAGYLYTLR